MLSSPIDVFIFLGIISAILLIGAVIIKSPTIGGFSGILFILDGAYGLAYNLSPLGYPVKFAVVFTLIAFGGVLIYESYLSWMGGEE